MDNNSVKNSSIVESNGSSGENKVTNLAEQYYDEVILQSPPLVRKKARMTPTPAMASAEMATASYSSNDSSKRKPAARRLAGQKASRGSKSTRDLECITPLYSEHSLEATAKQPLTADLTDISSSSNCNSNRIGSHLELLSPQLRLAQSQPRGDSNGFEYSLFSNTNNNKQNSHNNPLFSLTSAMEISRPNSSFFSVSNLTNTSLVSKKALSSSFTALTDANNCHNNSLNTAGSYLHIKSGLSVGESDTERESPYSSISTPSLEHSLETSVSVSYNSCLLAPIPSEKELQDYYDNNHYNNEVNTMIDMNNDSNSSHNENNAFRGGMHPILAAKKTRKSATPTSFDS